jgi:ankyrin repeat protein
LHTAALNGQLEVCEVLVACGANVGAVNKYNDTAAALARKGGHEDVALYLEGLK